MEKIVGVEIDMVVEDTVSALKLYEGIFETVRIEATEMEKGSNEAVFTMYGIRFHLLDENEKYQLIAPKPGDPKPMWINVSVPDIQETYSKAMQNGCAEIQPVNDIPEMGIRNAMFSDPFGYIWMLHQIDKIVSFEDRVKIITEQMDSDNS